MCFDQLEQFENDSILITNIHSVNICFHTDKNNSLEIKFCTQTWKAQVLVYKPLNITFTTVITNGTNNII